MKRVGIFLLIFIVSQSALSQDADISGYQAEVLAVFDSASDRIVQLAEAVPEELYAWRPAEGVRSFREVFLHLANGNYMYPGFIGYDPPEGFERGMFDQSVTDKDEVIKVLQESIEYHRVFIGSISNDELENTIRWFGGRETTVRGVLLFITRHTGEHLGQLIAYARMNDIVPPWSR